MPYAIFEDGSHQFRVREGDTITVDRRDGEPGSELVFDKVLLIAGDGAPTIGDPAPGGCPGRRQGRPRVPRQEDRDPEVPPPQEHASPQRPPPVLHLGPDHRRSSARLEARSAPCDVAAVPSHRRDGSARPPPSCRRPGLSPSNRAPTSTILAIAPSFWPALRQTAQIDWCFDYTREGRSSRSSPARRSSRPGMSDSDFARTQADD